MTQARTRRVRAELARAKVNLALHITGQRQDGYHELDSLVAFPQIGDRLSIEPAEKLELVVDGPFSRDLAQADDDNLVLKAARAFGAAAGIDEPAFRLTLTKRLPVASGIGGGSTDAATAIRLLEDETGIYLSESDLLPLAASLGADVPVCLTPEPQFMRGIGDRLQDAPDLPRGIGIVLVNPREAVPTPQVFQAMLRRDNPGLPRAPEAFAEMNDLVGYLASCRNDMQEAAIGICPRIGEILKALAADPRVRLARMSGSGATCFGLCALDDARSVEADLRKRTSAWWIVSGALS